MSDRELFARAAAKAASIAKKRAVVHVHSWACTYEVCGVGPTRESLIAESLRRVRGA